MSYVIIQQGDTVETYIKEIQVDTRNDFNSLPANKFNPGDTCLVLEDSSVHRYGQDLIWHEL